MSSMSRRHLMLAATGIAAMAAAPRIVFAQAAAPAPAAAPTGPFTLPPLTYPTNAFEPHIDAKTMEIHHDRHHQAFITNLNNLAKTNAQLATAKVEDVAPGFASCGASAFIRKEHFGPAALRRLWSEHGDPSKRTAAG